MDVFDKNSQNTAAHFMFFFACFSMQKVPAWDSFPFFNQIQNAFVHLFAFVLVGISNIHYLAFYWIFSSCVLNVCRYEMDRDLNYVNFKWTLQVCWKWDTFSCPTGFLHINSHLSQPDNTGRSASGREKQGETGNTNTKT